MDVRREVIGKQTTDGISQERAIRELFDGRLEGSLGGLGDNSIFITPAKSLITSKVDCMSVT
jgi:hypothetical protein